MLELFANIRMDWVCVIFGVIATGIVIMRILKHRREANCPRYIMINEWDI